MSCSRRVIGSRETFPKSFEAFTLIIKALSSAALANGAVTIQLFPFWMSHRLKYRWLLEKQQGRHHNGDQAGPHILCLICVHSFGAFVKAVQLSTSQPANVFSHMLSWHFRRPWTGLLKFERGTFWPPSLGGYMRRGGRDRPIIARLLVPISSSLTDNDDDDDDDTYDLSLTVFQLFSCLQKRFCPRIPLCSFDSDTMTF